MSRRVAVKTVLWGVVGALAVVTVARFWRGLGAVTNLSDAAPWGLWVAFDVMSGVALAAGGFTLAATVHIFHLKRFHAFARPAILTAFLGYTAVVVGLLYDLGLPWHIWHPILYPQDRSALFEVAMCVMLYLTVLAIEFAPVVLEHSLFDRPLLRGIHRWLEKYALVFIIAGIVLSTLHQSSLGSLFLIAPGRLNPLWYTPLLPVLYFVSAVGLGLMMVLTESNVSAWLFGHEVPSKARAGLGLAAAWVLLLYVALRLGDLALRGKLALAFAGTGAAGLFWFELSVTALVPMSLCFIRPVRESRVGLSLASGLTILGVVGYRFDTAIVAYARPAGASYFPSWMEIVVSLGIVSLAVLAFLFFTEHLHVFDEPPAAELPPPRPQPLSHRVLPRPLGWLRGYSLALVLGTTVAFALLPRRVLTPDLARPVPALKAMAVDGWMRARPDKLHDIGVLRPGEPVPLGATPAALLVLDGDRDWRRVIFPHAFHEWLVGPNGLRLRWRRGEAASLSSTASGEQSGRSGCATCHHANLPLERNSACASCHRDMFSTTDLFDHQAHVVALRGRDGCTRCHANSALPKTRATSTPCLHCHKNLRLADSYLKPKPTLTGLVPGYEQAMHGLCVECHRREVKEHPDRYPAQLATCATCHRAPEKSLMQRLEPYAAR